MNECVMRWMPHAVWIGRSRRAIPEQGAIPRPAVSDLSRQESRGRPQSRLLQHPEGVHHAALVVDGPTYYWAAIYDEMFPVNMYLGSAVIA
jgi:hypothetical protein